jgi:hypothetical protein
MLVSADEYLPKSKPREAIPLVCVVVLQVVLKAFAKALLRRDAGVVRTVIAIEDINALLIPKVCKP